MAKQIPTSEPRELVIGSAWAWDATYPNFPASDSWQLNYFLRGPDDLNLVWATHVAAGSGAEFEVRVTAAQSAAITRAGSYRLIGRVSKSGDTWDGEVVYNAHLLLLADPSDAVDAKSFNRRMLEAIDAALLAGVSASAEAKRISVNGRSIEYRDLAELEGRRAHYANLVTREENPSGSMVYEAVFVRA